jgi:hypothetical protein
MGLKNTRLQNFGWHRGQQVILVLSGYPKTVHVWRGQIWHV